MVEEQYIIPAIQYTITQLDRPNDSFCAKYKCLIFSQCLRVGLKVAVIFTSVMSVVYQHCSIVFILVVLLTLTCLNIVRMYLYLLQQQKDRKIEKFNENFLCQINKTCPCPIANVQLNTRLLTYMYTTRDIHSQLNCDSSTKRNKRMLKTLKHYTINDNKVLLFNTPLLKSTCFQHQIFVPSRILTKQTKRYKKKLSQET